MKNLKKKAQEKIVVFGEEVTDSNERNESGVVFGVLLLLSGTVLLLNSVGLVPWDAWQDLTKFWPLLLILGGLQIILGKNPFSRFLTLVLSLGVLSTAVIYVLQNRSPEVLKYIPRQLIEWSNYWEVIGL